MNTKLIIISPETLEEQNDLIYIANEKSLNYKLYIKKTLTKLRYIDKLLDIFFFVVFILHQNIKVTAIFGAPCLRNRIVSIILRKKFICYMRCLHTSSENLSSLSDKLGFYFKRIGLNNKLTNPYKADIHLVSSNITTKFLQERQAGNNIINIGALWLKNIRLKQSDEKRIFYITQAFEEHNFKVAHREQEIIIKFLDNKVKENNLQLLLKVHPRDNTNYKNISIFKGNSIDFLSNLTENDVIISTFSTLAFEAIAIKANVQFISFPAVSKEFNYLYEKNNIPYSFINEKSSINDILLNKSSQDIQDIFEQINMDYTDVFI